MLRASERGNATSPFKIAHTPRNHPSFTEYQGPAGFPPGDSMQEVHHWKIVVRCLDSALRYRKTPLHRRGEPRAHQCRAESDEAILNSVRPLYVWLTTQPSRRHRISREGRSQLRLDRARHDGDGDWVNARLYGKPWFEKPQMILWEGLALASSFWVVGETRPRFASASSALVATFAVAWLAPCVFTRGKRLAGCWLLLPHHRRHDWLLSRAAKEMPFSAMPRCNMSAAPPSFWGLHATKTRRSASNTLARAFYSVFPWSAVDRQRPAAIISRRRCFFWARLHQTLARRFPPFIPRIASFCLTAFPWYILCARRNPELFASSFIEHNFKREPHPQLAHPAVCGLPPCFLLWDPCVDRRHALDSYRRKRGGFGI